MQSFYTQLFSQHEFQNSQMAALAQITHLSHDKLRGLASYIIWSIWD